MECAREDLRRSCHLDLPPQPFGICTVYFEGRHFYEPRDQAQIYGEADREDTDGVRHDHDTIDDAANTGSVYYKSPHFDDGQRWISGAAVFVSFLLINFRPLELLNFNIAFGSLVLD